MSIFSNCNIDGIEKDKKLGTTNYTCSDGTLTLTEAGNDNNQKTYNYNISTNFELPTKHYILKGNNTNKLLDSIT